MAEPIDMAAMFEALRDKRTTELWRTGRTVIETADLRTTVTIDATGQFHTTVEAKEDGP